MVLYTYSTGGAEEKQNFSFSVQLSEAQQKSAPDFNTARQQQGVWAPWVVARFDPALIC